MPAPSWRSRADAAIAAWSSPITAQERRVAELVATGRSNQQIAQHLSVSVNTVETHLKHVFSKLGVRSRLELVGRGFQEQGGSGGRRPLRKKDHGDP
ncbi:MAG: helix-turn-helix transcriptional regulator [Chloroflexi bacterium]|nr:MAG: helix-turn-helix transcriptional regulator [Chloroflexota bacterium]